MFKLLKKKLYMKKFYFLAKMVFKNLNSVGNILRLIHSVIFCFSAVTLNSAYVIINLTEIYGT